MFANNTHLCTINFHCIVMIIVIINSQQCANMTEVTLKRSLHGSNCHTYQYILFHYDCLNETLMHNSFSLNCSNCNDNYNYHLILIGIMSEMTLNVSLHGLNTNKILRHFL